MTKYITCEHCNSLNCRNNRECIECGKTLVRAVLDAYVEPVYIKRNYYLEMYKQFNLRKGIPMENPLGLPLYK